MLRNRYVIAVVAAAFLFMIYQNIEFFMAKKRPAATSGTVPAVSENAGQHSAPEVFPPSSAGSDDSWRRDPFWYEAKGGRTAAASSPQAPAKRGLTLEGTDGNKFAIINGSVLAVGDAIEGYVVVEIRNGMVRVKGPKGQKTLNMIEDTSEKE